MKVNSGAGTAKFDTYLKTLILELPTYESLTKLNSLPLANNVINNNMLQNITGSLNDVTNITDGCQALDVTSDETADSSDSENAKLEDSNNDKNAKNYGPKNINEPFDTKNQYDNIAPNKCVGSDQREVPCTVSLDSDMQCRYDQLCESPNNNYWDDTKLDSHNDVSIITKSNFNWKLNNFILFVLLVVIFSAT